MSRRLQNRSKSPNCFVHFCPPQSFVAPDDIDMLDMPRNRLHLKLKFNSICLSVSSLVLGQYFTTRLFCFVCKTIKWVNMIGKAVNVASQDARSSKKYCFWELCRDHRVFVSQSKSFGSQWRSHWKLPASWPHIETAFPKKTTKRALFKFASFMIFWRVYFCCWFKTWKILKVYSREWRGSINDFLQNGKLVPESRLHWNVAKRLRWGMIWKGSRLPALNAREGA